MIDSKGFDIMSLVDDRHIEGLYSRRRTIVIQKRIAMLSKIAACLVLGFAIVLAVRYINIKTPTETVVYPVLR